MKVAIIHDHFLYPGGAERVLLTLLTMFPNADVYTAFATKETIELLKKQTSGRVSVSPLNFIQFFNKIVDWLKLAVFFYWESLDLTSYDLVVSSSHSFSPKSVITQPHTRHISYIHTPPRYLYTEFNETQVIRKPPLNILLSPLMTWLRMEDYLGAQRPDVLIANSKTVQARIKKYYRRGSTVIYPPVTIPKTLPKQTKKEYFLVVSRLAKQKGIDQTISACNEIKLPLVIVGEGTEEKYLKSIAGPTISFRGFVPDEQISEIYAKAKALLYFSLDEDFGLVPVESMAQGVPVIAYNSGGVRETVLHEITGVIFNEYSIKALTIAIQKFETLRFSETLLVQHAKKYSEKHFMKKLSQYITQRNTN